VWGILSEPARKHQGALDRFSAKHRDPGLRRSCAKMPPQDLAHRTARPKKASAAHYRGGPLFKPKSTDQRQDETRQFASGVIENPDGHRVAVAGAFDYYWR